jgi:hypothetical protein
MSLPTIQVENLHLQRLYTSDDGTQLELVETDRDVKTNSNIAPYPILSIHADEQEKLYMGLFIEGVLVKIPVTEVERAIEYAKHFVHSESWFEAGNELSYGSDRDPYAAAEREWKGSNLIDT